MHKLHRATLAQYPLPQIQGGSKETRGRIVVVGSHMRVPGAALLVAEAALRAGAGRLQIAVPDALTIAVGIACPEAMVVPFSGVEALLAEVDAVAIGAGTFAEEELTALCGVIASKAECALTFDAGALSAVAATPSLLANRKQRAVLTPHYGELARMLDVEWDAVEDDPSRYTIEAARRFDCVVAGKGAITYVATPDGMCFEHAGGTAALAVSGSGDVLSGIVGGLLSRHADPLTATLWGVALHGEAGRRVEARIGPGLLAREVAKEVPAIVREWSPV